MWWSIWLCIYQEIYYLFLPNNKTKIHGILEVFIVYNYFARENEKKSPNYQHNHWTIKRTIDICQFSEMGWQTPIFYWYWLLPLEIACIIDINKLCSIITNRPETNVVPVLPHEPNSTVASYFHTMCMITIQQSLVDSDIPSMGPVIYQLAIRM